MSTPADPIAVRRVATVLAMLMLGALLASCATPSPSTPSPTPTASSSASASIDPTASPTPTPTVEPSAMASPTPTTPDPRPRPVVGLTAQTGGGSGEVLLRWTQSPEPDVVSYVVLRATSPGGPSTRIGTVSRDEVEDFEYVPFVDSTATVAYYRVVAVDSAGQQSHASAEVCGASPGHTC